MELLNLLEQNSVDGRYPMHMPGHKRDVKGGLSRIIPWEYDVTEIDGFDNLHSPEGLLKRLQEDSARVFCCDQLWISVNGSTGAILSAISSCGALGKQLIVAANCHKSVFHAAEILGKEIITISPKQDPLLPFCGSVSLESVENALQGSASVCAVVLTSPTYDGIVSDIRSIAECCHRYHVPLIVDQAHGAHFGFANSFPQSANVLGADLVIASLHKTLPALTQTAILCLNGTRVSADTISHYMDVFETSSPSYLLMASIDNCVDELKNKGEEHFAYQRTCLNHFYSRCEQLQHLHVLLPDEISRQSAYPSIYLFDDSKILILLNNSSLRGDKVASILRKTYQIEPEMVLPDYVLCLSSCMDHKDGFERLADALIEIDRMCEATPSFPSAMSYSNSFDRLPFIPQYSPSYEFCDLSEAKGKVAASYVVPYPPGIPCVIPGERITQKQIDAIRYFIKHSSKIEVDRGVLPHQFAVLKDEG